MPLQCRVEKVEIIFSALNVHLFLILFHNETSELTQTIGIHLAILDLRSQGAAPNTEMIFCHAPVSNTT